MEVPLSTLRVLHNHLLEEYFHPRETWAMYHSLLIPSRQSHQPLLFFLSLVLYFIWDFHVPGILHYGLLCLATEHRKDT